MRSFGLFLLLLHLASANDNSDGRGLDSDRTVKHVEKNNDIVVSNNLETRSRLILLNGNMHFRAGIRRNITFDVGDDGGIFFHNLNILDIPSREDIAFLRSQIRSNGAESASSKVQKAVMERQFSVLKGMLVVTRAKQISLEEQFKKFNASRARGSNQRRIRQLMYTLNKQVDRLYKLMKTNECDDKPCQNGGTCLDLFAAFHCLCPPHMEGPHCEKRFDECAMIKGTHADCQNGGTCVNNEKGPGTTCKCPPNTYGSHCQEKSGECTATSTGLCGEHGHCVSITPSYAGAAPYKCVCDYGYRSNEDIMQPLCIDIDECAGEHTPCFKGYGNECLNLPGGFKCTGCPKGFYGDGITCEDINECYSDPCSQNPRVECINTKGSFSCAACPAGYEGDGFYCKKIEFCANNPCNEEATCIEEPNEGCLCPEDKPIGSGLKDTECHRTYYYGSGRCSVCENGATCQKINETHANCFCAPGFHGDKCEFEDKCYNEPDFCGEVGTCHRNENDAYCVCPNGFTTSCGIIPQKGVIIPPDTCGMEFIQDSGNYTMTLPFYNSEVCTLTMKSRDTRKILKVWVTNYTHSDLDPGFDNIHAVEVKLKDATNSWRYQLPTKTSPYYTKNSHLHVIFFVPTPNDTLQATVHWQAVEPICGGRLDVSNSPFSFKSSKAWEECQWFLDAPNDQLIEVTVEKMITATGAEVNCTVNSLRFYDSGLIDQNVQMGEICADVEQPYVKRFSTNHASLQFTYDSYMASEETLRDCKLSTSSTNNTDDAPRCGIYFMVSFKGVPKTTDCGGVINAQTNPVGFIQTPNFGHAYPPDLMCVWEFKLRKDPNETLSDTDLNMFTMDVVEFDVRGSNEPVPDGTVDDDIYCPGDFIEFDDITKHCNGNRLPVQLHFFDEFKLEFHSDSQYSGKGFKMLYKASCYHSYSNPTGIVRSPNLRVRHHEPFTCTYNIHAPSSAIVKLKFDYIGLPGFSVGCLQLQSSNDSSLAGYDDYIELSGGHTSDASLNRRYHCARYPFVAPSGELIVSGTSGVQITYSTSGSANNTGFLFSYTVEEKGCGGYYHGESGVIKSPNYPNKYPNHMYCIYTIKTKGRQAVRLTFDDFDVENVASRLDCGFDAVEIYDTYQNEKKHGKLLGRYCGVANPPPIVSASGTLVVVFTSDRSVNGIGFTAHYDVVNLHNFCDVTLTQQSGVLEFNRSNYGNIEECNFRIVLPAMARIHLNITDFYMPCEDGVVTLRNGGHSDSPKFPQLWPDSSFCDSKPVPELITQGNQAFISLLVKSTRNTTLRIEYKMIEQSCGGSIRGYTGEIATPQYPKADSHQLMCEWEITVAPGNRIRFQIDKMDDLASADHNGVCQPFARNYIDLAEGPRNDPTVLRKYCKREVAPEPLITSDNSLVVKYNQVGGSINGGLFGFLGRFVTVCNNIVLSKPFGSIQSPGYPYPTEEARVCSWTIRTAPGSRIKVIFHRFRLDGSMIIRSRGFTECMSNYLSVRTDQIEHVEGTEDGKATDKMKATKFCNGFAEPQRIFSKSNDLQFNFTNTKQAKENHFWLSWSTEGCGDYVYSNATKLSVDVSDFVAANLSLRRECNWVMYAPIGYVIKVDVMEMHTVEQINTGVCPDKINELNGVMFFTGTNFTDYPQWSYCGRIIGQNKTYTSHTNRLAMRLGMDAKYKTSRNGTVFRAFVTYVKLDNDLTCTGKVKVLPGHNQTITSPGFPTKYPRAIECAWQFETVKGFSLAYNLSHFVTPGKRRPPQLGFPTNIRCSSALMYIEGGLAVYSGEYARNDRLYSSYRESKGAVSRICNDITEPVIFNVLTNESTVTFHGAPYDATVPSGDSGRKDKVGFVLEAFAVCGGTLEAGAERRTLSLREHMLHNNGGCAFKVTRENQTLLDQKIVVGFELLDLNAFDDDKEVFINVTCGISRKPNYASTKNRHINTVECTEDILVEVSEIPQNVTFMLHYDTVGYMCGDIGDAVKGIYEISGDIDCDYVLENSAGNKVVLHIDESTIPESEDCAQSYVEIREGKRKRLLSRLCGNISPRKYEAEKLYLRVLRKPFETAENEDDEDVPTTPAPTNWLKFRFEKSLGGVVKSNKIILPVGSPRIRPADETIVWSVRTNKSDEHIEVTFRTLIGVKVQINEEVIDSLADDEPTRIYTSNELEIKALAPRTDISHFELTWKPIRPAANGSEAVGKTVYVEEEFTCGGELEATFSPKNLTLPTSDVNKYANDLKCRWKIKRPLLHGISFKLKLLDVEEHANCAYDYLTVGTREFATLRELEDATFMHRICRKDQANYATLINYDDEAFIYFVSDRSKSFSGFTLEYKLDCRTFEYLNAEKNKFVYTLNSPLYPETGGHNFSCMWGIMLETNRDLIVKAISMDLAPPQEDNQCKGEYLLVNSVPHSNNAGNNVHYYCGNNLFNYTAKYGRVFITYENSGETHPAVRRQGFQLLIEEITHMCSETLYLDEIKKKGVIQSPGYPENSPNSLDCEWIIAAPPGHRIKFTVDTEQFMLENADPDECKDDYLEIYDGPSGSSPLIGKFCGDDPPSTLFSTDSHLFVRFVTDYYSPSEGWKATYELASCGGTVVLSPSVNTSITSPNFPEAYPAQEECEWIVKAPKGHFVEGHLKHLWLAISDNCKQEYVTVLDGLHPGVAPNTTENRTVLLPPSCSMRSVNDRHFHSHHGTALVKFMANTTYARGASRLFCLNRKCGFEIELSASKYECGGDVEDDEGQLVVPGYPDHVLPGVECVWNFKAGIGYRYKLDLEFVNEDGFYEHIPSINGGPEQPCFPDLEAWNGPVESRYSLYSLYQRFCVNRTSFVSNADIMTVVYEDRAKVYRSVMYTGIDSTRFHKPFRLRYTRVDEDFDEFACMWHVYDDQNITIHDMSIKRSYSDMMGLTNTGSKSFCHIRIENQKKESTVALYFTDFRAGRPNIRLCGQSSNQVHIVGQTLDEWPIKDVLCSGIVQHNVYNNSYNSRILDIFIMNNPFSLVPNIDQPVQFNLSIVYNQCGGDITEELYGNFGTIRAPGTQDGGNYSNNADCLWHLKAPEGLVIKLSVTKMDLEYDVYCNHDVLEVAEGLATSSQLHRYCNSELIPDTTLEDRFKRLISRGRYLTLHFHSNNEINGKGFEIDWEFVTPDSNNSCGFHTHAMEGEIVSPGYPDVDYPNYASCLWEISVPPGFHVKLNFDRLDIAKSAGCLKDYLAVYQEHQSRGKDPMRNYLFYFDHDELVKRICGIDAIAPIETESRRVRLNFTTNNDITARGFRLTWEAKCGTVFQLNHGEVMSPFYPSYYPNEDMECIYQINPPTKYTQIVTIRIDDLELDDTLVDGKRKPCGSDYVQIIDVAANRVAFTACGRNNEEAGFSPISIKGPVAVRFVSNTTFFQDNKRKRMRGFHLTYALSDCGGEIVLDEETSHMTGTITSPSFPLPYHHKLNCVWNVTAPDGYVIAAKFRQMDIEGSEQCYFDYIELWDGVEATNTTTWGRICGQTPPFGTKMTKTNNMLIQFHTDETTSKGGFSLVLTATLGPEKGCGGEIRADTEWRTIQPPLSKGEEMDTYMNNLRCWWRISADKGSVIEFKLSDVDLEQRRVMGNGSCYDFLAIYDGPQGISPWLLRPSCLAKDFDQEHLHYYSSYKKADVYFETDSSDAFGGFTLQFRAIEPDCGGVYTAKAGEDQLLVYNSQRTLTRTHQRYKRCRFFIRGEENEPIELSMNSFSFPTKTAKCDEEFFEVSDVGTVAECQHPACATEQKDAQNIYRTCGSNVFWRFVSKTSLVQIVTSVVLQSQFTSSFNLTYTLLDSCNRTITVDDPYSRFASGRVHSPNFPYQYDANSTCITRIKVPDEYRILLVFKQFMIERGAYTLRRNPYWRRIQGEPGSRGIPRLYSKRQVGQFRGIGGQMTSFGGISKFFDDNCKFDALRVTYNMTGNLTKTLCGFATPPPVLSAQNQMVLNFTSDASSNHGGFDANYYLIKTYQQEYQKLYEYAPIYEKSGVVVNLGFPGYSVNTTYRAFVLPPRGMTCEMSITRYLNKDLVTCNNGDVLKVATVTDDGTHWTEIECASEMSVRKISAGLVQKEIQSFKIEFNTDSDAANDGRGFMATWDCSEAVTEVLVTDQWDTKIVE